MHSNNHKFCSFDISELDLCDISIGLNYELEDFIFLLVFSNLVTSYVSIFFRFNTTNVKGNYEIITPLTLLKMKDILHGLNLGTGLKSYITEICIRLNYVDDFRAVNQKLFFP